MMFFGLMGLAALVIDMGFARLAQRQMQTAVDSAALEGLRWRDVSTDQARRGSRRARWSPACSADLRGWQRRNGAVRRRPVVNSAAASAPPTWPRRKRWSSRSRRFTSQRALELNLSDATEGDMSAGTYGANPLRSAQRR